MGIGYSCGYCGRDYKTPVDRGKCEVACEAEKRKQEELNKSKKLNEEKSNMFNEIQEDTKKLSDKINIYNDKYDATLELIKPHPIFGSLISW